MLSEKRWTVRPSAVTGSHFLYFKKITMIFRKTRLLPRDKAPRYTEALQYGERRPIVVKEAHIHDEEG